MYKEITRYFELNTPIEYKNLNGKCIPYSHIAATILRSGVTQLKLTTGINRPEHQDVIITMDSLKRNPDMIALRQNSNCKQVYPELIKQGVLIEDETHKPVYYQFTNYKLYTFKAPINKEILKQKELIGSI